MRKHPKKRKNKMTELVGHVISVCKNSEPGLPKLRTDQIFLIADFGVKGDYHAGKFIRHRWLAKKDPTRLNNRQVLLIDDSILADIGKEGISPKPGELGENITLEGIKLMRQPIGTKFQIGDAVVELTEIRRPCYQLNAIHPNLQNTVMPDKEDESTWNAGMLATVIKGGTVQSGFPVSFKKEAR